MRCESEVATRNRPTASKILGLEAETDRLTYRKQHVYLPELRMVRGAGRAKLPCFIRLIISGNGVGGQSSIHCC